MRNRIKQSGLALMGAIAIALAGLSASGHHAYGQDAASACPDNRPCGTTAYASNYSHNMEPDELTIEWKENQDRPYYRIGWLDMAKYLEWEADPEGRDWLDLFTFRDVPTGSVFVYPDTYYPGNEQERSFTLADMDAETHYAVIVGSMAVRFDSAVDWGGWAHTVTPPRRKQTHRMSIPFADTVIELDTGDPGPALPEVSGGRSPYKYRIRCYDSVDLPPGLLLPPGREVVEQTCVDLELHLDADGHPLPFRGTVDASEIIGSYHVSLTVVDSSVPHGFSHNLTLFTSLTLCTGIVTVVDERTSCLLGSDSTPTPDPAPER